MNQENKNEVVSSTTNQGQMLAGSPGIIIAPVNEQPVDASSPDKGKVNVSVEQVVPTTVSAPVPQLNPAVLAPKVNTAPIENVPPTPPTPPVAPVSTPLPKKKKRGFKIFIFLLVLLVLGMGAYIIYDYMKDLKRGECSLLVASDNSLRELDINSSIVEELYDKVKTNIREDVAYNTFDDTLKLYLAYRQIPISDFYDSNCNLYNSNEMSNFTCSDASSFVPKAFKVETLEREVKKLFGDDVSIPNQNIVLGTSCYGGYQYIPERGEYVQGYCSEVPITTYNVDKELISATVQGDTITLKEKVRYYSANGIATDRLQNGIYVYTFKLDNSYHYAYVNRSIEES